MNFAHGLRAFRLMLVALFVAAPHHAAQSASPLGLHLAACTQGHAKVPAECGTFGVYENRAARSGRIIALRVIVLKAKHPTHRAIALLAGGPGESSADFAPFIADGLFGKEMSTLRDGYDILLVDNRGMGQSHPFRCVLAPPAHPELYFRQIWPDALLSACRSRNAATSDLSLYNTNHAVDDLDDVRAARGYPKLVLDGGSYGTFFGLVYLRRHPNQVESAVLNGVSAPHFQPLPGSPDGAQTALDDLIAKCRRDRVCNTHFPKFSDRFSELIRRFDRGPILVPMKSERTKPFRRVLLSKEVFVDRLRQSSYDPANAAYIPFIVEQAHRGDLAPVGDLVNGMTQALAGALDIGALLSYTCADEMPFISDAEVKAAAAHSYASDLRIRAQRHACTIWNVPPMPSSFNEPVRSAAPILMITGSDDPATPPRSAAQALHYLPNAKQVIVQGAGHASESPCVDRLIVEFVRAKSAKHLDTSRCNAAFTPPPFATK